MRKWLAAALFVPSFYGFVTWGTTLALYSLRLIDWHASSVRSMAVFLAVLVCFGASLALFLPFYRTAAEKSSRLAETITPAKWQPGAPWHISDAVLWVLHIVGFMGLALYVREILGHFDSWTGLLTSLLNESYLIRQAEIELLGIYLAYFGWMAIPLTILRWRFKGRLPAALLIALVAQCAGNLLFIDRTRPIWLVFISVLILFPFVPQLNAQKLMKRVLGLAGFGVLAFYLIGMWVGKIGEGFSHYGFVGIGQEFSVLYYYLTSGFAYFDVILEQEAEFDDIPQRSLYPLFKAASMLGMGPDPVSQILPFIEAPFPANVGTFLEPYFSDGGMLYMALGIAACTFGVDFLAYHLFRSNDPFALFCWANLSFVSFIAFFVPKLVSTPVWLFLFIAGASIFLRMATRPRLDSVEDLVPLAGKNNPSALPGRRLATAGGPVGPVPGFEYGIPFVDRPRPDPLAITIRTHRRKATATNRISVLFLTRYGREGPSSRVRALQFFDMLDQLGVTPDCAPLLTGEYLRHRFEGRVPLHIVAPAYARRVGDLLAARRYDVVWLEKELFPWLPYAAESLGHLAGRPLLVDYDDAIHERYRSHPNALVRGLLGEKIDRIMRRADIVTAGNDFLAAHARAAGASRVELLPSVVDVARYPEWERAAGDPFTIGWIGSPGTAHYLEAVRPALERAMRDLGARVRLIGAGGKALAGLAVERIAWHEQSEAGELALIDVGIMPLADTPWERGKCGYKIVQYMAASRPVVASPVGVNATLVESGKDGFLATTPEEWYAAFSVLAASRELRRSMGAAARTKVEREYSVAVMAPRLAELLRSLAS